MGDRDGEALARFLDDAALEPVRAALGMRGDDDLVRAEGPERVLDRLQRIAVADLALRLDAGGRSWARLWSSRSCAAARAPSSSETQWRIGEFSAGVTTSTSSRTSRLLLAGSPSAACGRRRSRSRRRGSGARRRREDAARCAGGRSSRRACDHQATTAAVSDDEDAEPDPLPTDQGGDDDRREVARSRRSGIGTPLPRCGAD